MNLKFIKDEEYLRSCKLEVGDFVLQKNENNNEPIFTFGRFGVVSSIIQDYDNENEQFYEVSFINQMNMKDNNKYYARKNLILICKRS